MFICSRYIKEKTHIMSQLQPSPFQFGTLAMNENFIDRVSDRALLKQQLTSYCLYGSKLEQRNGEYVFVDPIYKLWIKTEYA